MRAQRRWTAEEIEALKAMTRLQLREVAEKLQRSNRSVVRMGQRLGIRFRDGRVKNGWTGPRSAAKPTQRVKVLTMGRVDYCHCGAPVSNWQQHYERVGHRRIA